MDRWAEWTILRVKQKKDGLNLQSDVRTAAVTPLTSPTEGFPGGSLGRDGGRGGGGGGVGLTVDGVAGRTGEEDPERNIYLGDDDTEKWAGDKTPEQEKESGKLEVRFSELTTARAISSWGWGGHRGPVCGGRRRGVCTPAALL